MTQLRRRPRSISNWFAAVECGIAPRRCSFMDIDSCEHDRVGDRLLFKEFKEDGERFARPCREALAALSRRENVTVWFLRRRADGRIGFGEFGSGRYEEAITVAEYQRRYRAWWAASRRAPVQLPKAA